MIRIVLVDDHPVVRAGLRALVDGQEISRWSARPTGATARGETVLAPTVAATLVRRTSNPAPTITAREVAVLELLARGLGNKEIAKELFVSEATVKSHLSHVYTKLGVDTRAGAVSAAIEQRIIRA